MITPGTFDRVEHVGSAGQRRPEPEQDRDERQEDEPGRDVADQPVLLLETLVQRLPRLAAGDIGEEPPGTEPDERRDQATDQRDRGD